MDPTGLCPWDPAPEAGDEGSLPHVMAIRSNGFGWFRMVTDGFRNFLTVSDGYVAYHGIL